MRALVSALALSLTLVACAPEDESTPDPPATPSSEAEAPAPVNVSIEDVCLPDQGVASGRVVPDTVRAARAAVVNWALAGDAVNTAWGFTITPKGSTYWPRTSDSVIVGLSRNGRPAQMTLPPQRTNPDGTVDSVITYNVTVFCMSGDVEPIDPDIIIGQDSGGGSPDSIISGGPGG